MSSDTEAITQQVEELYMRELEDEQRRDTEGGMMVCAYLVIVMAFSFIILIAILLGISII